MDRLLIASIIQGEAGVMGPAGMLFVALVLQHRIWDCGHSEARVAREWYGRAGPSEEALRLAAEAARADEAALDAADSIAKLRLAVKSLQARVKWLEEQMGEDGT